jgi:hypothetical protein
VVNYIRKMDETIKKSVFDLQTNTEINLPYSDSSKPITPGEKHFCNLSASSPSTTRVSVISGRSL